PAVSASVGSMSCSPEATRSRGTTRVYRWRGWPATREPCRAGSAIARTRPRPYSGWFRGGATPNPGAFSLLCGQRTAISALAVLAEGECGARFAEAHDPLLLVSHLRPMRAIATSRPGLQPSHGCLDTDYALPARFSAACVRRGPFPRIREGALRW